VAWKCWRQETFGRDEAKVTGITGEFENKDFHIPTFKARFDLSHRAQPLPVPNFTPCRYGFKLFAINPSNAELNLICHLLALLGAHHILHVRRIRVNLVKIFFLLCRILLNYILDKDGL